MPASEVPLKMSVPLATDTELLLENCKPVPALLFNPFVALPLKFTVPLLFSAIVELLKLTPIIVFVVPLKFRLEPDATFTLSVALLIRMP